MDGAGGGAQNTPRTVEQVYEDFSQRRSGVLKALSSEVENFYTQCDPEKENLCLYGYPDGTWEVALPAEEVPPELPEPALGINFARDGMQRKDWLSLVAVHSDAWLLAVSFYYGARFDKNERKRLFTMVNELPTVYDMVTGRAKAASSKNSNDNKRKQSTKPAPPPKPAAAPAAASAPPSKPNYSADDGDSYDEEDDEQALCGICQGPYGANEFWIACDSCETWYHGKCVKVTPARAEHMKNYKCPQCAKRARP
eukprot:jgi/Chlat1/6226/Chrsp44S05813